jgi:hypothetical protein
MKLARPISGKALDQEVLFSAKLVLLLNSDDTDTLKPKEQALDGTITRWTELSVLFKS